MKGLLLRYVWSSVQVQFRALSSSAGGVDKTLLSKLRKQTGIPFINCKKALAKFDNNFDEAKKWLLAEAQKEGWARATKLQSRPMSQGLIAVMGDDKQATMLEVNCETDFVSKNEKFIALVTKLVQECNNHFENQSENKVSLDKVQLGQLTSTDNMKLSDIVALTVGNLGENMALRRSCFMRASTDCALSFYVHPSSTQKSPKKLLLGKYGALVELRTTGVQDPGMMSLQDLGSHLTQHIVGMNPQFIGEYTPPSGNAEEAEKPADEKSTNETKDADGDDDADTHKGDISEDALLQQEFLLDTTMKVGELLCMNNLEVLDFKRFACGEEIEGENTE